MSPERPPLLEIGGLSKTFPGLVALDDVSLAVASGEIVALVGQNGSGKSTFVKCLTGVHQPDPGAWMCRRGGEREALSAVADLRVIHQDLGLVGSLSTVENLDLGREGGRRLLRPVLRAQERERARRLLDRLGATVDVDAPVSSLTPAERTVVAIARALAARERPDELLLLDEPTAALHGDEVERLFASVRALAAEGAGVVFISHRLDEVLSLSDRIVALRGGRVVADVATADVDHDALVRLIVGRDVDAHRRAGGGEAGRMRLSVSGLRAPGLGPVDLAVRAGEIVGIGGLLGSGRESVCAALFGADTASAEVRVDGKPVGPGPRGAIAAGMGYIPADRASDGAVLRMSARENLTLPGLGELVGHAGRIRRGAEGREAEEWATRVELTPPEPDRALELFSGGNQQKVVIARWLRLRPRVLLLEEPTQGVDVGAKAAVYRLIDDAASAGTAVVVASSDEHELCTICDRVVVLREGRVATELAGGALTEVALVSGGLGLVPDQVADLFADPIGGAA